MADRNLKANGDGGAQDVGVRASDAQAATGSADENLQLVLINQVSRTLWAPSGLSDAQAINAAMAALKGLAPSDELEGMLAAQMVATHAAAMDCLRRAMIDGQTFEGRDQNLKHAAKLLGVYTHQVEALDKHRGKGQQKITVEHVTVNAGGQAIVGNVQGRAGAASASSTASTERLALPYDPAPLAPEMGAAIIATPKQKTPTR